VVNGPSDFDKDGFAVIPDLLPIAECDAVAAELTAIFWQQREATSRVRGGLRNMLRISPLAAAVATSEKIRSVVSSLTGGAAFPVRAILFDKTAGTNWSVPWHQDLAIAVVERIETDGFGPWSVKEGVVHVQPPPQILASMVTIRLHLDDCIADNGALRILPGSHLQGELGNEAISKWAEHHAPVTCEISKGGALLMRPLLLHASAPAKNPSHRRVLHVEYAAIELPNGLKWSERP
jgi:ectoine hydroxylase-related dioxygenase (phytanoyl-CoA dioxygenase family)